MSEKDTKRITSEVLKNSEIKIFSQRETDGKITYILTIDGYHADDEKVKISDRIVLAKVKGDYKIAKRVIGQILSKLSIESKEVNKERILLNINQISEEHEIEFTNELMNIVKEYNPKDNNDIEIERENKLEEILDGKKEEKNSQEKEHIAYDVINKKLQDSTIIDITKLPTETIQRIARDMQKRIEGLNNIITPEDADRNKDSLISYMKCREEKTDEDRIMEMFAQNLNDLDLKTVVECLKALESEKSEDSRLYSVYLKLEERRVIDRIQKALIDVKLKEKLNDGEIERYLEHLEESKLLDIDFSNIEQLEYYIMSHDLPREILEYMTNKRKVDFQLMKYIRNKDIESKGEIIEYLESKIVSFGQLGNESGTASGKLRTFIEKTQYKSEDKTDSNKFLLQVANMEREYIEERYKPIMQESTKEENSSLQSYEKRLSELEQEERDLQNQYDEKISGKIK